MLTATPTTSSPSTGSSSCTRWGTAMVRVLNLKVLLFPSSISSSPSLSPPPFSVTPFHESLGWKSYDDHLMTKTSSGPLNGNEDLVLRIFALKPGIVSQPPCHAFLYSSPSFPSLPSLLYFFCISHDNEHVSSSPLYRYIFS